jgi:2-haloacid dehalogenase
MRKIDTIIFDLGGVLIDWNPRYLYRTIFDTEADVEGFIRDVVTMDWNEEQDGGRSIEEANKILVAQFPQWESEIKAFYARWEEMLGGPIQETVDILSDIRSQGQYRLLALTNWSAETFPIALDRYDFLQWFEGILVSGVEKLKKPDPKIYQLLIDRYNCNPEHCIFIDDNRRNVDAAITEGIDTHHFVSPKLLSDYLQQIGVLT